MFWIDSDILRTFLPVEHTHARASSRLNGKDHPIIRTLTWYAINAHPYASAFI